MLCLFEITKSVKEVDTEIREQRERHHCKKYPEATYINPMWWQYTLGGSTAEVYQFPVKMAAAITAHKIQV